MALLGYFVDFYNTNRTLFPLVHVFFISYYHVYALSLFLLGTVFFFFFFFKFCLVFFSTLRSMFCWLLHWLVSISGKFLYGKWGIIHVFFSVGKIGVERQLEL